MKTQLLNLALLLAGAGLASAADDAFASVRQLIQSNQVAAAEAALTPLAASDHPDPRVWQYLSIVRARQKRTKEAIALAEKAAAADPTRAEFHSNIGSVIGQRMSEVGVLHQATLAGRMLDAFKKSVELDPEHVPGYAGLARYYTHAPAIAGGSREKAEGFAREIERRNAFLGTLELARIAEHFEDWPAALARYTQATRLKLENASVHEALGRVSEKLGQAAEARRHYEKALAIDPARETAREAIARLKD